MPREPWSYDLLAELYDEDMGRNLAFDDIAGYRHLLPGAPAHILECGCGTGRLTLPLLGDGYRVCAVDRSMPMLRVLQGKLKNVTARIGQNVEPADRLRWPAICAGDVASLPLRGRFEAVMFGYCGFQYLLTQAEIARFLDAARRCLDPGGRLILDSFIPRRHGAGEHFSRDYQRTMGDGRRLERWKRVSMDGERVNRVERRYIIDGDEQRAINTVSRQRTYTPEQLLTTLEQHGFCVVSELFDYGFSSGDEAQFYTVAASRTVVP